MRPAASPRVVWLGLAVPLAIGAAVLAQLVAGAAGVLVVVTLCFALALALRLDSPAERELVRRIADAALLALPGALVLVFAFNGGGFFPEAPAVAAVGLALVLIVRTLVARDPFEGFGRLVGVVVAALGLYAGWCLLSLTWSHAPGRAFVESDRALFYVLVLVLFGSIGRDRGRIGWVVRGLVAAIAGICVCALITRTLPHVWPITPNIVNNRLSFPITYWNSLGLLAALGSVLALHLTSSLREPPWVRVIAAVTIPLMATTLLFTYSRGAIAAGLIGVVLYLLLGRPRGLVTGLLAVVPPTTIALITAYRANLLATRTPTTPAAVAQGHHVAAVLAGCLVGAAVLRVLCLPLDSRLDAWRPSAGARRAARVAIAGTAVAAVCALLVAGAPHWVDNQYHRFLSTRPPEGNSLDTRTRLTDPSNNGRLANWKVALHEFRASKLHGEGAGTYALAWAIHRPAAYASNQVVNAHSLYIENLSDLGIVGFGLIVVLLGTIVYGIAARIRGPGRSLWAALLAVTVAWAFEAGLDWQWQMPVVTVVVLSLGALALARPARPESDVRRPGTGTRVLLAGLFALAAVMPLLVGISQAHLDDAVSSFQAENCRSAEASAHSSLSALGFRPEPYEVLGYCALQDGQPAAGVADFRKAVAHDPDNWRYRYGLAVARAAAGQDPRPDLRRAELLGPYQVLPADAAELFLGGGPRLWRERAPRAPLPDELTS